MKRFFITIYLWLRSFFVRPKSPFVPVPTKRRFAPATYVNALHKNRKKPAWVVDKVLYLKAITGFGCGKVAQTFNRLYGDRETILKTYVYTTLKTNQYRLRVVKRQIRNRPPRREPVNQTWGMDLTTVTLKGKQKTILGIIDHGSRMCLRLEAIPSQHAWQIIKSVVQTIKAFGFPKSIRTDNGHCFTAKVTEGILKLLGIKHQKTNIASPWQNGRIERFFGSFKPLFKAANFDQQVDAQTQLDIFAVWYNQMRTHDNLGGLTPHEAWQGRQTCRKSEPVLTQAWDGVLTGYYFPD